MAYVRRHGNQLAIVHGVRDTETGKVGQHVLFNIYSQAEAREILTEKGSRRLHVLLQDRYPRLRLNWSSIVEAIREDADFLPEREDNPAERVHEQFHRDLVAFTRQVVLTSPQDLSSADDVIQTHRLELDFLTNLLRQRVRLCGTRHSEFTRDDTFAWRYRLKACEVPPDVEEAAQELYEKGEYEQATAAFHLLTECFEDYAEGHNYLGLIALRAGRLEEAVEEFQKTMEVGRRRFPKRYRKDHYWGDLDTRPYIRGIMNLALAFARFGRYDEALELADRLERECGMDVEACAHRAVVLLLMQRWAEAGESARRIQAIHPGESFIAAFAEFELGRRDRALTEMLHGTLNRPFTARLLFKTPGPRPDGYLEAEDHNGGVDLMLNLSRYLALDGRAALRFFRKVMATPEVRGLVAEVEDCQHRDRAERRAGGREAFDRIHEMQSMAFAKSTAAQFLQAMSRHAWWSN